MGGPAQRIYTSVFWWFSVLEIGCEIVSTLRLLAHETRAVDELLIDIRTDVDDSTYNSYIVSLIAPWELLDLTD